VVAVLPALVLVALVVVVLVGFGLVATATPMMTHRRSAPTRRKMGSRLRFFFGGCPGGG